VGEFLAYFALEMQKQTKVQEDGMSGGSVGTGRWIALDKS
jgi:hypothetical protein